MAMLGAIRHRGPDAQGAHVEPSIALGSARLAIIDLRGGDQPIYNEDRSVVLVYNGEVYDHQQLLARLSARGHTLASRSDSEALVHLYEDHGIGFVEQLDGMFGFALWDVRRRRLHVVRDRFGVKPVHYTWDGQTLCFASEVKALLRGGAVRPQLDLGAFTELLTFQNILGDDSLFAGVRLLPAGSVLTLDDDGLRIDRYWDPLPRADGVVAGGAALAAEVRERFEAGVRRQLVSDVPIASYLSGGLDTGAITAVAARELPRLTTFVTGFDTRGTEGMESGFDERADARELADELGTHHKELLLDAEDLEIVLPRVVGALEEPRMSFSYPNYLTAGAASRWVKVVLSGAGGDEVFGGYPWRYRFASEPNWRDAYFGYWERLLPRASLGELLTDSALGSVDLDRPRAAFDAILDNVDGAAPLDAVLYYEFKTFLHGLLVIEDKLSMAHSLETRVPFLDNELVDFMLSVPASTKLAGDVSKALFRQAMGPALPEAVLNRRKTGFTPPQAAWFRGRQHAYTRSVLLSDRARERNLVRPEVVTRYLDEHASGAADHRLILWTLLCMEWWHRLFVEGEHLG